MSFREELRALIEQHADEIGSKVSPTILTSYLITCMHNFDSAVRWYDSMRDERVEPVLPPPPSEFVNEHTYVTTPEPFVPEDVPSIPTMPDKLADLEAAIASTGDVERDVAGDVYDEDDDELMPF